MTKREAYEIAVPLMTVCAANDAGELKFYPNETKASREAIRAYVDELRAENAQLQEALKVSAELKAETLGKFGYEVAKEAWEAAREMCSSTYFEHDDFEEWWQERGKR